MSFAPEAQRILAGGGAQRNHRDQSKDMFPAPEGRQIGISLSPPPGLDGFFDRTRWFHHRLISGVPPGRRSITDLCRNFSCPVCGSPRQSPTWEDLRRQDCLRYVLNIALLRSGRICVDTIGAWPWRLDKMLVATILALPKWRKPAPRTFAIFFCKRADARRST